MKFVCRLTFLGLALFASLSSHAFNLQGVGQQLTIDGGESSQFIAIKQNGVPFGVESEIKNIDDCQDDFIVQLPTLGTLIGTNDNLAMFVGQNNVMFTLHGQVDGQEWQAVTSSKRIRCRAGQSLKLKATFYYQHASSGATTPSVVYRSFLLKGTQGNEEPVTMNVALNFERPPVVHSCRVSSAQQTITLEKVSVQQLTQEGKIRSGNHASFVLNCTQTNAVVWALIYDHLDARNFGIDKNILTNHGTAQGVGVQLFQDEQSQAIKLGAKPAHHYFLANDGAYVPITNHRLNLSAGYIKTGEISSGTVKAQAGVVFFYP